MRSVGLIASITIGLGWLILTVFLVQLFTEMQDPNNAMGLAGGIIFFAIGSGFWLALTGVETALLVWLFLSNRKNQQSKTPPE